MLVDADVLIYGVALFDVDVLKDVDSLVKVDIIVNADELVDADEYNKDKTHCQKNSCCAS